MEERKDAMDKLVAAAYEYADDRIAEVQDIYRKKAEEAVRRINRYSGWAEEAATEHDRREWNGRAAGMEEALEALGFKVGYNVGTGKLYLA